MNKTDFEIMSEMAKENKNLIGASNELVGAKKTKKGTEITMGFGGDMVGRIFKGELIPVMYLVDSKEFFKRQED